MRARRKAVKGMIEKLGLPDSVNTSDVKIRNANQKRDMTKAMLVDSPADEADGLDLVAELDAREDLGEDLDEDLDEVLVSQPEPVEVVPVAPVSVEKKPRKSRKSKKSSKRDK